MADYWKSNPKKFCEFCKCWIADNKPSIDFHEKGKNHQQNVKRKISEVKKNAVQKRKDTEDFKKQFAKMEAAALKAVKKDMKSDSSLVGESDLQTLVKDSNKKAQGNSETTNTSDIKSHPIWMECQTPQGYTYYYNKKTGESIWQKPKELMQENENAKSIQRKDSKNKPGSMDSQKSTSDIKDDATQKHTSSTVVETERHPLLGAWTVVETPVDSHSAPIDETNEPQETGDPDDSEPQDTPLTTESTNPELVHPESRKRLAVFKEKTLKSDEISNSDETVGFKKRKVKNNRNARKRCDEED